MHYGRNRQMKKKTVGLIFATTAKLCTRYGEINYTSVFRKVASFSATIRNATINIQPNKVCPTFQTLRPASKALATVQHTHLSVPSAVKLYCRWTMFCVFVVWWVGGLARSQKTPACYFMFLLSTLWFCGYMYHDPVQIPLLGVSYHCSVYHTIFSPRYHTIARCIIPLLSVSCHCSVTIPGLYRALLVPN